MMVGGSKVTELGMRARIIGVLQFAIFVLTTWSIITITRSARYEIYATTSTPDSNGPGVSLPDHDSKFSVASIPETEYFPWKDHMSQGVANNESMTSALKVFVYEHQAIWPLNDNLTTLDLEQAALKEESFEGVIFKLFRSYPGRTWIPEEADIFVAPYGHWTHCKKLYGLRKKYAPRCGVLSRSQANGLKNSFQYFSQEPDRHLWVYGKSSGMEHPAFFESPLHLSFGPAQQKKTKNEGGLQRKKSLGDIVLPYFSASPASQPSALINRSDHWWTRRPRRYGLLYS